MDASSRDIDEAVRELSASGGPIYWLDEDEIAKLSPDLLISQDHCRVCAIASGDIASAATCANIQQLVLRPSTLQDCFDNISSIADAMGVPARGERLLATLEEKMKRLRLVVAQVATKNSKPRVALLEWCDPIMGCGYWLPELVQAAGGTPLHCPPAGGATPTITFQALVDSKPDIVICALCGFGLTRAAEEIQKAWNQNQIDQIHELCQGRVYVVDGNFLINRSGPRVVESAEALAEAIWLDLQGHFGHYGTDYLTTLKGALPMVERSVHTGSTKGQPQEIENSLQSEDDSESILSPQAAEEAVASQLTHLRLRDIPAAFAMNTNANQKRWCDVSRFQHVVETHDIFSRLLKEEPQVVTPAAVRGNIAVVSVNLPPHGTNDAAELTWTLVAEDSGEQNGVVWRTEMVGF